MSANSGEHDLQLSQRVEDIMVQRNLRGMADVQSALRPGYYMRAARMLNDCDGTVLIGTGFPVAGTFETDGPVGAIVLYRALEKIGAHPVFVCGAPLAPAIAQDFRVEEIAVGDLSPERCENEAQEILSRWQPQLVVSIERPGLSDSGRYFNMRGEDISAGCACFDSIVRHADCKTIGIGDGGNEIGMGNIREAIEGLDIVPAVTTCDELLIADVSNWAVLGLLCLISRWRGVDLLADVNIVTVLEYISHRGSVDGVTRENTLTEDSLPASAGEELIAQLRRLIGQQ